MDPWTLLQPWLPAIGGAITVVGAIIGLLQGIPMANAAWARYRNRIHIRHITNPHDPDLIGLRMVQMEEFSEGIGDDSPELIRWLTESRDKKRHDGFLPPTFIALVLKKDAAVCGYLTAQYFADRRTVFLWYIAVPKASLPDLRLKHDWVLKLIAEMLAVCDRTGHPWQHALTEVETGPEQHGQARAKLVLFQTAAQTLSRLAGRRQVNVYRIGFDFKLPVIRPELVTHPEVVASDGWLLYAPRTEGDDITRHGEKRTLKKAALLELLDTLFVHSYAQAYYDSQVYRDYQSAQLLQQTDGLPEEVDLNLDWPSRRKRRAIRAAPSSPAPPAEALAP